MSWLLFASDHPDNIQVSGDILLASSPFILLNIPVCRTELIAPAYFIIVTVRFYLLPLMLPPAC